MSGAHLFLGMSSKLPFPDPESHGKPSSEYLHRACNGKTVALTKCAIPRKTLLFTSVEQDDGVSVPSKAESKTGTRSKFVVEGVMHIVWHQYISSAQGPRLPHSSGPLVKFYSDIYFAVCSKKLRSEVPFLRERIL